jgi:hypothetical protein
MNSESNKEPATQKTSETSAQDSSAEKNSGEVKSSEKRAWSAINKDLKQALNTWEILSEEMAHKISPEEEQLQEVKRLLGELKDKLKQFSE